VTNFNTDYYLRTAKLRKRLAERKHTEEVYLMEKCDTKETQLNKNTILGSLIG
jgi:hypothetical protein